MKNIFVLLLIIIGVSSCQNLEEMNINPNLPTETHPQLLLTKIEWDVFRDYSGTGPLYALKMLVQTDGENSAQYYKWDRGDFDPYAVLRDVSKMVEEAERIDDPTYLALAKFFRAYYFYNLTLTFGDIPYSAALKGESEQKYAPEYDNQEAVFKGILQELKDANEILAFQNKIIVGDIIYDGNILSWRKLINAFRLKIYMTLSGKQSDPAIDFSTFKSIYQNEPIFTGLSDNAALEFLDQQGNRYPDFNSSGFSSGMYMDSTFIQRLQVREDPRLFIYSTQTKSAKEEGKAIDDFTAYEGGDPAAPYGTVNEKATLGHVSKVNDRYHKDPVNEPYVLLGYSEQQLILAEAAVRGWIDADAASLYESAVKASFKFYEMNANGFESYVSESAAQNYLSKPINNFQLASDNEKKIEMIVMQKYLQSFFQMGWTSFFDHHRTGYPSFRRPAGVQVPFRWIYPQSEYNFNSSNVTEAISRQFDEGNDHTDEKTWWLK